MKKFEYRRIMAWHFTKDNAVLEDKLNDYGKRGWELVCFTFKKDNSGIAYGYFKKEIE